MNWNWSDPVDLCLVDDDDDGDDDDWCFISNYVCRSMIPAENFELFQATDRMARCAREVYTRFREVFSSNLGRITSNPD
jgi:hypothetical protein